MKSNKVSTLIVVGMLVVLLGGCGVGGYMYIGPQYYVWQQGKIGEAKLREAESSRQVATEEAKAKHEAAKHLAEAEIERAKGVAAANKIIGDSLNGNESYLKYLWIQSLESGHEPTIIYVPTECNVPIMEAGRSAGIKAEAELVKNRRE